MHLYMLEDEGRNSVKIHLCVPWQSAAFGRRWNCTLEYTKSYVAARICKESSVTGILRNPCARSRF